MTLSTITPFSGFTDKAPLSPSYLNSKFAEIYTNLNGLNQDAAIFQAHLYPGADASAQLTACLSDVTRPTVIDCRSLQNSDVWSCVTVDKAGVQLLFGASNFSGSDRFLSVVSDDVVIRGGGIGVTKVRRYDTWNAGQNQHINIETSGVSRFEITGMDLESYVTGPLAKIATSYNLFLHDDAAHTKGTRGFLVHGNRFRSYGNEPGSNNRHIGVMIWTTDVAPPRLVGNGIVSNNLLDACAGRNIECALADNVTIIGNTLTSVGSNMTIVGVGIRMIGSTNIDVVGNTIRVEDTALENSDGIQINGDNRSEDINIIGNTIYSTAKDGTGIKASNVSRFLISGNVVRYEGVGTGVNGILMECQSSNSTRAASEGLVTGNYVTGFTDAQITIAATPPTPTDITITNNRLGRPYLSAVDTKYFNISSDTDTYVSRVKIYGNSCGTILGGNFASNVTTPAGGIHSLIGVGTGLLPSIVSHQAALIGEVTSTLSPGGQYGYGVIGLAATSTSTNSDKVFGGWFLASANIGEVEIGVRTQSADTNGVPLQWGVSKSTIKGQIDGAGTIRAFDGSAATLSYAFMSDSSLGFYKASTKSTIDQSYGTFRAPEIWATSGISVGNATAGGSLIPAISSTSSRVAAFVVQGSASSFTRIVWAAAQPGDQVMVTIRPDAAASSLSSGLILHSHCTVAGQVELRLSNVSTLVQNQSSKTYYFTRLTPF